MRSGRVVAVFPPVWRGVPHSSCGVWRGIGRAAVLDRVCCCCCCGFGGGGELGAAGLGMMGKIPPMPDGWRGRRGCEGLPAVEEGGSEGQRVWGWCERCGVSDASGTGESISRPRSCWSYFRCGRGLVPWRFAHVSRRHMGDGVNSSSFPPFTFPLHQLAATLPPFTSVK